MINNHVVSLDLAKQLYEAGIKIESHFVWRNSKKIGWFVDHLKKPLVEDIDILYPAPLASELGELLPEQVGTYRLAGSWHCDWAESFGDNWAKTMDDTEANARAKMLLYLKEKGLL